ncbi:MAG: transcriptional regulator [Propionibacteriaceae bacterium]|nr:transcriptional regulator [Propionibacteriaceae bacterium]
MRARWLVVLVTAATLVVIPLMIDRRPVSGSNISAVELAERVQASGDVAWSGFVESSGTLQVPDSDSFANLAQLLGEDNDLRVWWRGPDSWRVDRIRGTGETDLFRQRGYSVRWVFESETATISPVSQVRLPDASDLLPPTLARALLQRARVEELARLPARRVAGVDAPGLRLVPDDRASTVAHVDVWVEEHTGLPLKVELYGVGDRRPALSTTTLDLELGMPPVSTTQFVAKEGVDVTFDESVDVAAAANAFAPFDLPTSLGGLTTRTGADPGAVGFYGRGPTSLIVLPLRDQVAWPLRERLRNSAAAQESDAGTSVSVGLVGLLLTPDLGRGGGFLLAGTITPETLERAATELLVDK